MPESAVTACDLTTDDLLDGRIRLRQPRRGHRAGTDAVLLAAAVPLDAAGPVLDIGAGVGAAGLAIAAVRPNVTLGLVEIDSAYAALAAENLTLNGLAGRGQVHMADIFDPESRRRAGLRERSASVVVTNPPFFDPARARQSPEATRRSAHVMQAAGPAALDAWIGASIDLLAEGGLFIMIHRPEALPAILAAAVALGGLTLLSVHPQKDKPATRILVRGKKGSRAPFSIAPPLVLHSGDRFGQEAEAIHRGQALLTW